MMTKTFPTFAQKIILFVGLSSFCSVLVTSLVSYLEGWDFRLFFDIAITLIITSVAFSYLLIWKVKLAGWKKLLFTITVVFTGFILLFSIFFIFTRFDEFLIVNSERRKLEGIAGVENVTVNLYVEEYYGPQSTDAVLDIKDRGKLSISNILFYGPYGGDGIFNSGSIYLCSIGKWHLYSYNFESGINKKSDCINVGGPEWNFYNKHFLHLPIYNIPDLVKQYDAVLQTIENWPEDFCAFDPKEANYRICVGKQNNI